MNEHLVRVRLADPRHKLPMPGAPRLFGEAEIVDMRESFWIACLADGSILIAPPEAAGPEAAADA